MGHYWRRSDLRSRGLKLYPSGARCERSCALAYYYWPQLSGAITGPVANRFSAVGFQLHLVVSELIRFRNPGPVERLPKQVSLIMNCNQALHAATSNLSDQKRARNVASVLRGVAVAASTHGYLTRLFPSFPAYSVRCHSSRSFFFSRATSQTENV